MEFNPLHNYYGLDISEPTNRLLWNFWEFLKLLHTLSYEAPRQREIMGFGQIADEMAIDFETYYSDEYQTYLKHALLTKEDIHLLEKIDTFLEERSGENMPEFWHNESLETHIDWMVVRKMAKDALIQLGYHHLKVVVKRKVETEKIKTGTEQVFEWTQTYLVEQDYS